MRIAVVDSRVGNLGAIPNMLARLGAAASVTRDPDVIEQADRIVLPGVGSFDAALRNLTQAGVLSTLRQKVLVERTPLLGLCLGMELLADSSEEGSLPGLGWIPGAVTRFNFAGTALSPRVPHMGWNTIKPTRDATILADLGEGARFYFAHSYVFNPANESDILAYTEYGRRFPSVIQHENITGIQFHPEKSHRFGLAIFRNFISG